MSLFMYPVQQAAETPLVPAQICTKACLKSTLRWKGVIKSLHCIYSIFIFGLVSKNEYIRYPYSIRYPGTNIFVFGQVVRNEYIRYSYLDEYIWYSYSVIFSFMNIFVFVFSKEFYLPHFPTLPSNFPTNTVYLVWLCVLYASVRI